MFLLHEFNPFQNNVLNHYTKGKLSLEVVQNWAGRSVKRLDAALQDYGYILYGTAD